MSVWSWFKHRSNIRRRVKNIAGPVIASLPELREFVYLDEVSLRSLLSSQKGGMTDLTSEQSINGREAEVSGTVGANPGLVAKAELASRYKTSNSSTIQTSRKATVQSWFRELHEIDGLRLVEPTVPRITPSTADELLAVDDRNLLAEVEHLRRGRLVEFRVRLAADPVFHLGTMVSEFTAMADDHPDMFAAGNALTRLHEVQPINKILQRLLAGLIPIRALAIDYEVVEVDDSEYLVHKAINEKIRLPARPLQIVGVTEHEAYWKDLRRVLFSDGEFSVLARIARSGLHGSWTPVKLADLFADLAPGLVDQINSASRGAFSGVPSARHEVHGDTRLAEALHSYTTEVLREIGGQLSQEQVAMLEHEIEQLSTRSNTVSDQRSAFAIVTERIAVETGSAPTPARAYELRETARVEAGLSLFPALASSLQSKPMRTSTEPPEERLLDVDVIAIYW